MKLDSEFVSEYTPEYRLFLRYQKTKQIIWYVFCLFYFLTTLAWLFTIQAQFLVLTFLSIVLYFLARLATLHIVQRIARHTYTRSYVQAFKLFDVFVKSRDPDTQCDAVLAVADYINTIIQEEIGKRKYLRLADIYARLDQIVSDLQNGLAYSVLTSDEKGAEPPTREVQELFKCLRDDNLLRIEKIDTSNLDYSNYSPESRYSTVIQKSREYLGEFLAKICSVARTNKWAKSFLAVVIITFIWTAFAVIVGKIDLMDVRALPTGFGSGMVFAAAIYTQHK